jgi:hypothetical protein
MPIKRAANIPTMLPAIMAMAMSSKLTICWSNKVTTMANNIAIDDKALPLRAEEGCPSSFKPKINKAAASTYVKLITKSVVEIKFVEITSVEVTSII